MNRVEGHPSEFVNHRETSILPKNNLESTCDGVIYV